MSGLVLYVVVFVSGAAVLALEILGTRILGPFYGVSLFLWSALITVTLAALSLGYALGGRWADRGPAATRLALLLGAAGGWVLLVPFLKGPVLQAAEPLGLRGAVLAAATLLFAPPLTLLGMVSPYAIRLRASELGHVGRVAGNLYAVSTLASVLSALAVGFFLIPSLGVARLTFGIGLALLGASALAYLTGSRPGIAGVLGAIALLGGALVGVLISSRAESDDVEGLVEMRQSPYGEIHVFDVGAIRHLLIDGSIHSMIDVESGRSVHPYTPPLDVIKFLYDEPGSLLLVGLGGGSIAKSYAGDGWAVDAVEIDRAVGEMAHEHFGLSEADCATHYEDGRRFLYRSDRSWDVIVLDAYGSSSIPFHLATVEAFALVASRLAGGGVLAMNVVSRGWKDPLVSALAASLRQSFPNVIALPTAEPPDRLGNVILLASQRELEFDEYEHLPRPFDLLHRPLEHWWAVEMNHAWDNRFEPETAGAPLLTDDRNPVELWAEAVNLAWREELHEYFREFAALR